MILYKIKTESEDLIRIIQIRSPGTEMIIIE